MQDRRNFFKKLSGLTATLALSSGMKSHSGTASTDRLGELLPTRVLGKTGKQVTILGVGGFHIGRMSDRDAQETLETALEGGVRFFDTAEGYQNGGSEEKYGRLLVPKYRDVSFIMTKTRARTKKDAQKDLEASLRRLNTDYVDLWQVHSVNSVADVNNRIENGVFDVVQQALESGKVKHIGFTGHVTPAAHLRVLEKSNMFETCQMPINVADPSYESFIDNVMPKLLDRNIGVIAMKTLANGGFFGGTRHGYHGDNPRVVPDRLSIQEALYFVWSLPVSVIVTGPDDTKQMQEKIKLAKSFSAYDENKRQELIKRVADMAGTTVEFYKS